MVLTQSKWREVTNDPCLYQTAEDPTGSDIRSVKVKIVCKNKTALNTLAWVTVENLTVKEVLDEIFRINRINPDELKKVNCNEGMGDKVIYGEEIKCEYSQSN